MNLSNLTAAQLKKAASLSEKIEKLKAKLAALLGDSVSAKAPGKRGPKPDADKPKKRKMSAAGRAAISAAQKARWAAKKG